MEEGYFDDYTDHIDENEIRQAIALLKLEPLAYTDPNDQKKLEEIVDISLYLCKLYNSYPRKAETLTQLSLALEQWGAEVTLEEWFRQIMIDASFSPEERVAELYRAKIFQDVGPDAIDFSTYCILRYKRRKAGDTFDNKDIHIASQVGLRIAQSHEILDLTNTYFCVEMLLICGVDYIKNPDFKPMRDFFEKTELTATQKIDESYEWLIENLEQLAG